MNREEFIKKLHPLITHINASDNMSEEILEAINIMVEKVSKMTTEEIKTMVDENKKQTDGMRCGLSGPEYYEREMLLEKQIVRNQYFTQEQFDRLKELSNKMFANAGSPHIT